jgi:hypothetical protein
MEPNTGRAELERSIVALARELPQLDSKTACTRLAWLRREAVLAGYTPTAVLADGLAAAIRRDGAAMSYAPWLDALSIAAGCDRDDEAAGPVLLASVGVRFAA